MGNVADRQFEPVENRLSCGQICQQLEIPLTKCVKCEGAAFRLQEITLHGAAYKMMAAQCSSCQTPFALTEYFNVGHLLKNQEKAIADLEKKISHIQSDVSQIAYALNSMRR
jgi:hypothetical protein